MSEYLLGSTKGEGFDPEIRFSLKGEDTPPPCPEIHHVFRISAGLLMFSREFQECRIVHLFSSRPGL